MTGMDPAGPPADDDQVAPGEDFASAAGVDPSPQEVDAYAERLRDGGRTAGPPGVPPAELSDDDLLRELGSLHRTRNDALRHGSPDALGTHSGRLQELEAEYLRRFPDREVDPERLRDR
jgi:Family of unknown function (DUF6158)